jgi:hypothetical protein
MYSVSSTSAGGDNSSIVFTSTDVRKQCVDINFRTPRADPIGHIKDTEQVLS